MLVEPQAVPLPTIPDLSSLKAESHSALGPHYQPYEAREVIRVSSMPLNEVFTTSNGFQGRVGTLSWENVVSGYGPNASIINISGSPHRVSREKGPGGEALYLHSPDGTSTLLVSLDPIENGLFVPRGRIDTSLLNHATSAASGPMGGWRDMHPDSTDIQVTDLNRNEPLLALHDLKAVDGERDAKLTLWQFYKAMEWNMMRQGQVFFGWGETGGSLGMVEPTHDGSLFLEEPKTGQSLMRFHAHVFWNSVLANLGIDTILQFRDSQLFDQGVSKGMAGNIARALNDKLRESYLWKGAFAEPQHMGLHVKIPGFQSLHVINPEFAELMEVLALNHHRQLIEFWERYGVDFQGMVDFVKKSYVHIGQAKPDLQEYYSLQQAFRVPNRLSNREDEYIVNARERKKLVIPGGWGLLAWLDQDALHIMTSTILENSYFNSREKANLGFCGLEIGGIQTIREKGLMDRIDREAKQNLYDDLTAHMLESPPPF